MNHLEQAKEIMNALGDDRSTEEAIEAYVAQTHVLIDIAESLRIMAKRAD